MNKRRLTLGIRIIAGSFLIYWAFQFGSGFYSTLNDFKADIASKRPTKDYSYDHLLKKEKLTSALTYYIRGKEPLSTYYYDGNKIMIILEMQGMYAKPINDVVSVQEKSTGTSPNVIYDGTFNPKIVKIRRTKRLVNKQATNLNLNLYGDSINLEKNTEQLIYYKMKLENMSISYGNSDLINFHIEKKGFFKNRPEIELMLKKYNQKIYLILAIPKEEGVVLPKNLLLSLLK